MMGTLKKLVAEAVALVSKGSSNVAGDSEEKEGSIRIGRRETFLVVPSYSLPNDLPLFDSVCKPW